MMKANEEGAMKKWGWWSHLPTIFCSGEENKSYSHQAAACTQLLDIGWTGVFVAYPGILFFCMGTLFCNYLLRNDWVVLWSWPREANNSCSHPGIHISSYSCIVVSSTFWLLVYLYIFVEAFPIQSLPWKHLFIHICGSISSSRGPPGTWDAAQRSLRWP